MTLIDPTLGGGDPAMSTQCPHTSATTSVQSDTCPSQFFARVAET